MMLEHMHDPVPDLEPASAPLDSEARPPLIYVQQGKERRL